MSTPNPVPPPPPSPPGLAPSGSTNGTAVAGSVAAIIMYILSRYGITFPAGLESEIAILVAALGGYIPKSGRK